jgi:hypothetical protein
LPIREDCGTTGRRFAKGYLPPVGDPLHVTALLELIPIDLDNRWARRERLLLEDYLDSYPELGSSDKLPVDLIYAEYRVRVQRRDTPTMESYRRRFPQQFAALETMVERQTPVAELWHAERR